MKLSIGRTELQAALSAVSRAVSPKASIPVLSGILVTAQGGRLTCTGYDLDMAIEMSVPASIEAEGAVVLPARQATEIVKRLPREEVTLSAEGNSAKIQADRAVFDLLCMKAADYPALPTAEGASITLTMDELKETIGKVSFAAAADDSRAVLTGVLMEVKDGDMTMTATDSFRCAARKVAAAGELPKTVLPARFLGEIAKAPGKAVQLVLGGSWAQVVAGNVRYLSRLLEGEFPNVERIMPEESAIPLWLVVDREGLLGAIERVSVMRVDDMAAVILTLDEDTHEHLIVSSTNPAVGEAREEMVIFTDEAERTPMQVALRPRYLREALKAAEGENVKIGYSGNRKPVLIRDEDEGYRYVVMPVIKP
jgi:DNA polymerase-3 subunit beta